MPPLQMLTELETRALRVYTQCVELYTKWRLSRDEDILSAFNGVTNLVGSALGADLIHGLPNSHFDWGTALGTKCHTSPPFTTQHYYQGQEEVGQTDLSELVLVRLDRNHKLQVLINSGYSGQPP
jgi:hypothetical protein